MTNISICCPYCKKIVALSWASPGEYGGSVHNFLKDYYENKKKDTCWKIGLCPACDKCILVELFDDAAGKKPIITIYPSPQPTPTNKNIPEIIRTDIDEAKRCFSVNAYRACAALCRRALQNACKAHGAEGKELQNQIDDLEEKRVITSQIKNWAHSIRWVGNDAAHPNDVTYSVENGLMQDPKFIVTTPDAQNILDLTEKIMDILYVADALSKQVNTNHERKSK